MRESVRAYLDSLADIEGWLQPGAAQLICGIEEEQRRRGIVGARVEFGVHHGRSLILLALLDPDSPVLGLDLDTTTVQQNIARLGIRNAHLIKGDTNSATGATVRSAMLPLHFTNARFISIDGDHSFRGTLHDLHLAVELLCPDGVVLVDDVANPIYPGVHEALMDVVDRQILVPFAAAGGRIAMCAPSDVEKWVAHFASHRVVQVHGWPVAMTSQDAWTYPTLGTRADTEGVQIDDLVRPARTQYARMLVETFSETQVTPDQPLDFWVGEFMRDTGLTRDDLRLIAHEVFGPDGLQNLQRKSQAEEPES